MDPCAEKNGRTHEPSLRELTTQLDSLKELMDEKFGRVNDRFESEATISKMILAASKEAVTKADAANEKRFDAVNEFRQTLSDQTRTFMLRSEVLTKFEAQDREMASFRDAHRGMIGNVQQGLSAIGGQRSAEHGNMMAVMAAVGWVVALVAAVVAARGH